MRVLVACEESQRVCKAFRERGHEAFSCDIQPCSGGHPEWHLQCDVLPLLNEKWDLIIAHPPCQFLSNTGSPYLDVSKWGDKAIKRAKDRDDAFSFFMQFVNADCDKICIENPIGYPNSHYRRPDQIIQPWQFGHPYSKSTCLWLKGLEPLKPLVSDKPHNIQSYAWQTMIDERGKTISWNSELCRKLRSKTFEGIAAAMADQWGS